jgi:hypothetical protein
MGYWTDTYDDVGNLKTQAEEQRPIVGDGCGPAAWARWRTTATPTPTTIGDG